MTMYSIVGAMVALGIIWAAFIIFMGRKNEKNEPPVEKDSDSKGFKK